MMRMVSWRRWLSVGFLCLGLLPAAMAQDATQSKNYAPGFTERTAGSRMVVLPAEVELFSVSGGGVEQPRADWTQTANDLIQSGLKQRPALFGRGLSFLAESDADDQAEILHLHKAVVRSVFLHHMVGGAYQLPTKKGLLDWTLGDAVTPLRNKTGADYALYVWVRDSYASAERKAAIIAFALLAGGALSGGHQLAYASLVDLRTGRVVWFNSLSRSSGDLREAKGAEETIDTLLQRFPPLAASK
jgi:hypothetical protein